jgi:SAM-dependent methyltransferase
MNQSAQKELKQTIKDWWAAYPMTYGLEHGAASFVAGDGRQVVVEIGSREFFELADQRFYSWNIPRHNEKGYFGNIFDYERYRDRPVLEIGCGLGCMAMNWAQHGAQFTAVDINPVSVLHTARRFEVFDLSGTIREGDAENLPFPDDSFEYAYSWGVLHHTPNTRQAIRELYRVLAPGGRVGVMLYHRNSVLYRFMTDYIEGCLHLEKEFLNPLELASRYADGGRDEGNPHTWPVTKKEVREELFIGFSNIEIQVFGTDLIPIFNQWFPGLGSKLPRPLMEACARRWGWSLWITAEKAR